MHESDRDLLSRWTKQGDAEAFRALYHRYGGMVYGVSNRILGDAAEAQDVALESFEALAGLKRTLAGNLGAWLHRVAVNRARRRHPERCAGWRSCRLR